MFFLTRRTCLYHCFHNHIKLSRPNVELIFLLTPKSHSYWPILFLSTGHRHTKFKKLTGTFSTSNKSTYSISSSLMTHFKSTFVFSLSLPRSQTRLTLQQSGFFNCNTLTQKSYHSYSPHKVQPHSLGLIFVQGQRQYSAQ